MLILIHIGYLWEYIFNLVFVNLPQRELLEKLPPSPLFYGWLNFYENITVKPFSDFLAHFYNKNVFWLVTECCLIDMEFALLALLCIKILNKTTNSHHCCQTAVLGWLLISDIVCSFRLSVLCMAIFTCIVLTNLKLIKDRWTVIFYILRHLIQSEQILT